MDRGTVGCTVFLRESEGREVTERAGYYHITQLALALFVLFA